MLVFNALVTTVRRVLVVALVRWTVVVDFYSDPLLPAFLFPPKVYRCSFVIFNVAFARCCLDDSSQCTAVWCWLVSSHTGWTPSSWRLVSRTRWASTRSTPTTHRCRSTVPGCKTFRWYLSALRTWSVRWTRGSSRTRAHACWPPSSSVARTLKLVPRMDWTSSECFKTVWYSYLFVVLSSVTPCTGNWTVFLLFQWICLLWHRLWWSSWWSCCLGHFKNTMWWWWWWIAWKPPNVHRRCISMWTWNKFLWLINRSLLILL